MAEGTNTNDILLEVMEQAQKWVDDVGVETSGLTPEQHVEEFKKLYQAAFDAIAETVSQGAPKMYPKRQQ